MGRISSLSACVSIALLVLLVACTSVVNSAPVQETSVSRHASGKGCYYMNKLFPSGERIQTNEPCLNCTCVDSTFMCYLRVCPFVKPVDEHCVSEMHVGDCCPKFWCPEVYPRVTTQRPDTEPRGCFLDGRYYDEGARIPMNPLRPCEACYCIRNTSVCTMQKCELQVDGCFPQYKAGSCCPSRYNCTDEAATTIPPGIMEPEDYEGCRVGDMLYKDGESVPSKNNCETCYCMKHAVACAVHKCQAPADSCIPGEIEPGQCCPTKYECPLTTEVPEWYSTLSPIEEDSTSNISLTTGIEYKSTVTELRALDIGSTLFTEQDAEISSLYVSTRETIEQSTKGLLPEDMLRGVTETPRVDTSRVTETPKITEVSEVTETADIIKTSEFIETSKTTTLEVAETSRVEESLDVTETTEVKETSDVTETSKVTEASAVTETLKVKEISGVSEISDTTETSKVTELSGGTGASVFTTEHSTSSDIDEISTSMQNFTLATSDVVSRSREPKITEVPEDFFTSSTSRPVFFPSRPGEGIPGEGTCRHENRTYKPKEKVSSLDPCRRNCMCVNSVWQCEIFEECVVYTRKNCKIIPVEGECCPKYVCDEESTSEPTSPKEDLKTIAHEGETTAVKIKESSETELTTKATTFSMQEEVSLDIESFTESSTKFSEEVVTDTRTPSIDIEQRVQVSTVAQLTTIESEETPVDKLESIMTPQTEQKEVSLSDDDITKTTSQISTEYTITENSSMTIKEEQETPSSTLKTTDDKSEVEVHMDTTISISTEQAAEEVTEVTSKDSISVTFTERPLFTGESEATKEPIEAVTSSKSINETKETDIISITFASSTSGVSEIKLTTETSITSDSSAASQSTSTVMPTKEEETTLLDSEHIETKTTTKSTIQEELVSFTSTYETSTSEPTTKIAQSTIVDTKELATKEFISTADTSVESTLITKPASETTEHRTTLEEKTTEVSATKSTSITVTSEDEAHSTEAYASIKSTQTEFEATTSKPVITTDQDSLKDEKFDEITFSTIHKLTEAVTSEDSKLSTEQYSTTIIPLKISTGISHETETIEVYSQDKEVTGTTQILDIKALTEISDQLDETEESKFSSEGISESTSTDVKQVTIKLIATTITPTTTDVLSITDKVSSTPKAETSHRMTEDSDQVKETEAVTTSAPIISEELVTRSEAVTSPTTELTTGTSEIYLTETPLERHTATPTPQKEDEKKTSIISEIESTSPEIIEVDQELKATTPRADSGLSKITVLEADTTLSTKETSSFEDLKTTQSFEDITSTKTTTEYSTTQSTIVSDFITTSKPGTTHISEVAVTTQTQEKITEEIDTLKISNITKQIIESTIPDIITEGKVTELSDETTEMEAVTLSVESFAKITKTSPSTLVTSLTTSKITDQESEDMSSPHSVDTEVTTFLSVDSSTLSKTMETSSLVPEKSTLHTIHSTVEPTTAKHADESEEEVTEKEEELATKTVTTNVSAGEKTTESIKTIAPDIKSTTLEEDFTVVTVTDSSPKEEFVVASLNRTEEGEKDTTLDTKVPESMQTAGIELSSTVSTLIEKSTSFPTVSMSTVSETFEEEKTETEYLSLKSSTETPSTITKQEQKISSTQTMDSTSESMVTEHDSTIEGKEITIISKLPTKTDETTTEITSTTSMSDIEVKTSSDSTNTASDVSQESTSISIETFTTVSKSPLSSVTETFAEESSSAPSVFTIISEKETTPTKTEEITSSTVSDLKQTEEIKTVSESDSIFPRVPISTGSFETTRVTTQDYSQEINASVSGITEAMESETETMSVMTEKSEELSTTFSKTTVTELVTSKPSILFSTTVSEKEAEEVTTIFEKSSTLLKELSTSTIKSFDTETYTTLNETKSESVLFDEGKTQEILKAQTSPVDDLDISTKTSDLTTQGLETTKVEIQETATSISSKEETFEITEEFKPSSTTIDFTTEEVPVVHELETVHTLKEEIPTSTAQTIKSEEIKTTTIHPSEPDSSTSVSTFISEVTDEKSTHTLTSDITESKEDAVVTDSTTVPVSDDEKTLFETSTRRETVTLLHTTERAPITIAEDVAPQTSLFTTSSEIMDQTEKLTTHQDVTTSISEIGSTEKTPLVASTTEKEKLEKDTTVSVEDSLISTTFQGLTGTRITDIPEMEGESTTTQISTLSEEVELLEKRTTLAQDKTTESKTAGLDEITVTKSTEYSPIQSTSSDKTTTLTVKDSALPSTTVELKDESSIETDVVTHDSSITEIVTPKLTVVTSEPTKIDELETDFTSEYIADEITPEPKTGIRTTIEDITFAPEEIKMFEITHDQGTPVSLITKSILVTDDIDFSTSKGIMETESTSESFTTKISEDTKTITSTLKDTSESEERETSEPERVTDTSSGDISTLEVETSTFTEKSTLMDVEKISILPESITTGTSITSTADILESKFKLTTIEEASESVTTKYFSTPVSTETSKGEKTSLELATEASISETTKEALEDIMESTSTDSITETTSLKPLTTTAIEIASTEQIKITSTKPSEATTTKSIEVTTKEFETIFNKSIETTSTKSTETASTELFKTTVPSRDITSEITDTLFELTTESSISSITDFKKETSETSDDISSEIFESKFTTPKTTDHETKVPIVIPELTTSGSIFIEKQTASETHATEKETERTEQQNIFETTKKQTIESIETSSETSESIVTKEAVSTETILDQTQTVISLTSGPSGDLVSTISETSFTKDESTPEATTLVEAKTTLTEGLAVNISTAITEAEEEIKLPKSSTFAPTISEATTLDTEKTSEIELSTFTVLEAEVSTLTSESETDFKTPSSIKTTLGEQLDVTSDATTITKDDNVKHLATDETTSVSTTKKHDLEITDISVVSEETIISNTTFGIDSMVITHPTTVIPITTDHAEKDVITDKETVRSTTIEVVSSPQPYEIDIDRKGLKEESTLIEITSTEQSMKPTSETTTKLGDDVTQSEVTSSSEVTQSEITLEERKRTTAVTTDSEKPTPEIITQPQILETTETKLVTVEVTKTDDITEETAKVKFSTISDMDSTAGTKITSEEFSIVTTPKEIEITPKKTTEPEKEKFATVTDTFESITEKTIVPGRLTTEIVSTKLEKITVTSAAETTTEFTGTPTRTAPTETVESEIKTSTQHPSTGVHEETTIKELSLSSKATEQTVPELISTSIPQESETDELKSSTTQVTKTEAPKQLATQTHATEEPKLTTIKLSETEEPKELTTQAAETEESKLSTTHAAEMDESEQLTTKAVDTEESEESTTQTAKEEESKQSTTITVEMVEPKQSTTQVIETVAFKESTTQISENVKFKESTIQTGETEKPITLTTQSIEGIKSVSEKTQLTDVLTEKLTEATKSSEILSTTMLDSEEKHLSSIEEGRTTLAAQSSTAPQILELSTETSEAPISEITSITDDTISTLATSILFQTTEPTESSTEEKHQEETVSISITTLKEKEETMKETAESLTTTTKPVIVTEPVSAVTESTSSTATTTTESVTKTTAHAPDDELTTVQETEMKFTTEKTLEISTIEADAEKKDECVVNGTSYGDGKSIRTIEPCEKCHCAAGEIVCFKIICKLPLKGCIAETFFADECCPSTYKCPADDGSMSTVSFNDTPIVTEKDFTTPIPISFMLSTTSTVIPSTKLVTISDETAPTVLGELFTEFTGESLSSLGETADFTETPEPARVPETSRTISDDSVVTSEAITKIATDISEISSSSTESSATTESKLTPPSATSTKAFEEEDSTTAKDEVVTVVEDSRDTTFKSTITETETASTTLVEKPSVTVTDENITEFVLSRSGITQASTSSVADDIVKVMTTLTPTELVTTDLSVKELSSDTVQTSSQTVDIEKSTFEAEETTTSIPRITVSEALDITSEAIETSKTKEEKITTVDMENINTSTLTTLAAETTIGEKSIEMSSTDSTKAADITLITSTPAKLPKMEDSAATTTMRTTIEDSTTKKEQVFTATKVSEITTTEDIGKPTVQESTTAGFVETGSETLTTLTDAGLDRSAVTTVQPDTTTSHDFITDSSLKTTIISDSASTSVESSSDSPISLSISTDKTVTGDFQTTKDTAGTTTDKISSTVSEIDEVHTSDIETQESSEKATETTSKSLGTELSSSAKPEDTSTPETVTEEMEVIKTTPSVEQENTTTPFELEIATTSIPETTISDDERKDLITAEKEQSLFPLTTSQRTTSISDLEGTTKPVITLLPKTTFDGDKISKPDELLFKETSSDAPSTLTTSEDLHTITQEGETTESLESFTETIETNKTISSLSKEGTTLSERVTDDTYEATDRLTSTTKEPQSIQPQTQQSIDETKSTDTIFKFVTSRFTDKEKETTLSEELTETTVLTPSQLFTLTPKAVLTTKGPSIKSLDTDSPFMQESTITQSVVTQEDELVSQSITIPETTEKETSEEEILSGNGTEKSDFDISVGFTQEGRTSSTTLSSQTSTQQVDKDDEELTTSTIPPTILRFTTTSKFTKPEDILSTKKDEELTTVTTELITESVTSHKITIETEAVDTKNLTLVTEAELLSTSSQISLSSDASTQQPETTEEEKTTTSIDRSSVKEMLPKSILVTDGLFEQPTTSKTFDAEPTTKIDLEALTLSTLDSQLDKEASQKEITSTLSTDIDKFTTESVTSSISDSTTNVSSPDILSDITTSIIKINETSDSPVSTLSSTIVTESSTQKIMFPESTVSEEETSKLFETTKADIKIITDEVLTSLKEDTTTHFIHSTAESETTLSSIIPKVTVPSIALGPSKIETTSEESVFNITEPSTETAAQVSTEQAIKTSTKEASEPFTEHATEISKIKDTEPTTEREVEVSTVQAELTTEKAVEISTVQPTELTTKREASTARLTERTTEKAVEARTTVPSTEGAVEASTLRDSELTTEKATEKFTVQTTEATTLKAIEAITSQATESTTEREASTARLTERTTEKAVEARTTVPSTEGAVEASTLRDSELTTEKATKKFTVQTTEATTLKAIEAITSQATESTTEREASTARLTERTTEKAVEARTTVPSTEGAVEASTLRDSELTTEKATEKFTVQTTEATTLKAIEAITSQATESTTEREASTARLTERTTEKAVEARTTVPSTEGAVEASTLRDSELTTEKATKKFTVQTTEATTLKAIEAITSQATESTTEREASTARLTERTTEKAVEARTTVPSTEGAVEASTLRDSELTTEKATEKFTVQTTEATTLKAIEAITSQATESTTEREASTARLTERTTEKAVEARTTVPSTEGAVEASTLRDKELTTEKATEKFTVQTTEATTLKAIEAITSQATESTTEREASTARLTERTTEKAVEARTTVPSTEGAVEASTLRDSELTTEKATEKFTVQTTEATRLKAIEAITSQATESITEGILEESTKLSADASIEKTTEASTEKSLDVSPKRITESSTEVSLLTTERDSSASTGTPEHFAEETSSTEKPTETVKEETIADTTGVPNVTEVSAKTTAEAITEKIVSQTTTQSSTKRVTEMLTKAYKGIETTPTIPTTESTVPVNVTATDAEEDFLLDEGVCIFEGQIYHSAEQIVREDPCEFCFCFRGDIICLQQSCPPPAPNCHQTLIKGYCCPRYDCPVLVTSRNLTNFTRRKGVQPIIIQKRIEKRAARAAVEVKGCQINGTFYTVGSTVAKASGPCLHCSCEEGGNMRCDPIKCKPQAPLMLKMNNQFFRHR